MPKVKRTKRGSNLKIDWEWEAFGNKGLCLKENDLLKAFHNNVSECYNYKKLN